MQDQAAGARDDGSRSDTGDPFQGLVPASSRLIAAYRALESAEPDALLSDPLAAVLAGPQQLQEAQATLEPHSDGATQQPGRPPLRRRWKASRLAVRARWFDDALLDALRGGDDAGGAAPRQVVLLGAGMDTRAWRLPLPPGVAWFEADLPGVLEAKARVLAAAGAACVCAGTCCEAVHPLRAASWRGIGCDVADATLLQRLCDVGLQPAASVVWVVEGLLLYLPQAAADALLQRLSEAAGAGSVLLLGTLAAGALDAFGCTRYSRALLVKAFRSCLPANVERYLAGLGWALQQQLSYAGIAAAVAPPGLQTCLASAAQLDVSEDDLRRHFVFLVASKACDGLPPREDVA